MRSRHLDFAFVLSAHAGGGVAWIGAPAGAMPLSVFWSCGFIMWMFFYVKTKVCFKIGAACFCTHQRNFHIFAFMQISIKIQDVKYILLIDRAVCVMMPPGKKKKIDDAHDQGPFNLSAKRFYKFVRSFCRCYLLLIFTEQETVQRRKQYNVDNNYNRASSSVTSHIGYER